MESSDSPRDSVYLEITSKILKTLMIPMDLKKSTKYNHQNRTDQREVHSRPKGVNPQDQSRRDLNRKLIRIHQRTGSFGKVQEELIRLHWENNFQPQWFITLLWNDLPTRSETATSHSRHFRNVFLTSLLNQPLTWSATKHRKPMAARQQDARLVLMH